MDGWMVDRSSPGFSFLICVHGWFFESIMERQCYVVKEKKEKKKGHLKHKRGKRLPAHTPWEKKCLHAAQDPVKKVESLKETFLSFSLPFIRFLFLLFFFSLKVRKNVRRQGNKTANKMPLYCSGHSWENACQPPHASLLGGCFEAVLPQAEHNNTGMNKILNTSEGFRGIFFLIALSEAAPKLFRHSEATAWQRLNSEPTVLSATESKGGICPPYFSKSFCRQPTFSLTCSQKITQTGFTGAPFPQNIKQTDRGIPKHEEPLIETFF